MKRAIGWCAAWALYWAGDVVSRLIGVKERRSDQFVYPVYNALMGWSINVQDWAGNDSPWSRP